MKIGVQVSQAPLLLVVLLLLVVAISLTTMSSGFTRLTDRVGGELVEVERDFTKQLAVAVDLAVQSAVNPMYDLKVSDLALLLQNVKKNSLVKEAFFLDENAAILTDGTEENPREGQSLEGVEFAKTLKAFRQGDSLTLTAPVFFDKDVIGHLYVAYDISAISGKFKRIQAGIVHEGEGAQTTVYQHVGLALVLGLLLVAVLTVRFVRRLTLALEDTVAVADCVAEGDLNRHMQARGNDEVEALGAALNRMIEGLQAKTDLATAIAEGDLTRDASCHSEADVLGTALQEMSSSLNLILADINKTAVEVNSESAMISETSQSLSQGATQSAASLQEISASMAEVGGQTQRNAENATQASGLATQARGEAKTGGERMAALVDAIGEIQESSNEITKIIKTIDDIAFQTNLLALNAAVEAARAGRHGKGFAVVAEEVRSLAGRSAKAAEETAGLIEASSARVDNGVAIAQQTTAALSGIEESIAKAADLVGEIAAASGEQAAGIGQVSQGLSQIDDVTQANTARAEEMAAAAVELTNQAKTLHHLLSRFKLSESSGNLPASQVGSDPTP
ncbi:MAG: methyl-accepting chemotaxis protein [Planctomycetota bacterium]|jgi:methyl-accepting chemotaxis protein